MRDQSLDLRVQTAVLSNRLVCLDNPMLRDRITVLKAQTHQELRAYEELLAGTQVAEPASTDDGGGGNMNMHDAAPGDSQGVVDADKVSGADGAGS